jgi:4'-phosphopantetheinyl transferase
MLMDKLFHTFVHCNVICIGREETIRAVGFPPLLQKNSIHIWSALYGDLDHHYKVLSGIISLEEQKTASTFRKSADAKKYILRHGVLRIILGNYTHHNPEKISLITGKNGKHELDMQGAYADVSFNLSHTSDMVLIGITRKRRIGIDIVKMDPLYQYNDIAEYILTPAEKAFLQSIKPALRYQVFFRMWALKEAILKTTGDTLSMMKETDTSDVIHKGCSFPCCSIKYRNSLPPFFIWQFNSGPDHYGAIAAEIRSPNLNAE